jgi:isoaspartyl peptidase/L-asparaginase-like protein (Ntn-hydrolase superfamily)
MAAQEQNSAALVGLFILNILSAEQVLEHTGHSLLVGDGARQFALEMGFRAQATGAFATLLDQEPWGQ